MRTYCIAQGTLTSALWQPKCEGNLKREDIYIHMVDFPHRSVGKSSACSAGDPGSMPESGRFPWRRKWPPTPVFLPGESHGQRSVTGYSPWDRKSWTRLSN